MFRSWCSKLGRGGGMLLAASLVSGFITHAYNLFLYPLYVTDEGIYIEQAWSVVHELKLSPYTYFYDHAPAGWLFLAAWASVLPAQFQTFGNAINTGRALMLVMHVISVFFLFEIARRLSQSNLAAFVAAFLFNFSPLAVFYQREVVLDNMMVFWVLLSLYLATECNGRIVTALLAGLAFGIALITKENAVFLAPVIVYFLYKQMRDATNRRFAQGFWTFAASTPVSGYVAYAALKNELFPSHLNFNLSNPPADHVALLYTIWWQLHRAQGGLLDRHSLFWQFSFGAWLPKDHFILIAGGAATLVALGLGLANRQKYLNFLVAGGLAASYSFYLARGSVMLEFYVVPLLPFLALNTGMVLSHLLSRSTLALKSVVAGVMVAALLLPVGGGYVIGKNDHGRAQVQDLYRLPLTEMQADQVAWIRQHIPPDARLVIDDDIWADLHDRSPYYRFAHSHWKASADPDVRDKLFGSNGQNIDYVVMSNKMRQAMELNNGNGNESYILDAIDNHSQLVWHLKRGDIELQIYEIKKDGSSQNSKQ